MGVEPALFSPSLRSPRAARGGARARSGSSAMAMLLHRHRPLFGGEAWDMVIRAAGECGRKLPVGLLLVGDGTRRQKLEMLAEPVSQRRRAAARSPTARELARLLASADALVHGCEAETFCMVAAEARASGIPLIVPDRGAAVDQLVAGAGATYRAGQRSDRSSGRSAGSFDRGPELQRAAAVRASQVRTMDEHFAELFARYETLRAHCIAADADRGRRSEREDRVAPETRARASADMRIQLR